MSQTAGAARRHDRHLVAVLCLLSAIPAVSINLYLPAFAAISGDLASPISDVQQTLSVFLIGIAVGQLFYGPLSDRLGRRGPMLVGLLLYTAASAGCAMAEGLPALIALRLLQALGACAAAVVGRAVVGDRFERQEASRVFSLLLVVMAAAPILAPLVGGWIATAGGWRAVFWTLAITGAVCTAAALFGMPESRSATASRAASAESPAAAYLAALKNRQVLAYATAYSMIAAGTLSILTAAPEVLIGAYGLSPTAFGWIFGLNSLGLVAGAQLSRALLKRMSTDVVLASALAAGAAAGGLMIALSFLELGGLPALLICLFVIFISNGAGGPNAMGAAMSADPQRGGAVSALLGAGQFALGATGAAIVAASPGAQQPMAVVAGVCLVAGLLALRLRGQSESRPGRGGLRLR